MATTVDLNLTLDCMGKACKLLHPENRFIDRYMPAAHVSLKMRIKKNVCCINTENTEQFDCKHDIHFVNSTETELGHPKNRSSNPHWITNGFETDDPHMTISAEVTIINSVDMGKQLEPTIAIQNVDRSITDKECDDDNWIPYPVTADNLKDEIEPFYANVTTQYKIDTSGTVDEETLPLTGNCQNMPTNFIDIIDNKPVNTTTEEDWCLINHTSIPHSDENDCRMVDPSTIHSGEPKVKDIVSRLEASHVRSNLMTPIQETTKAYKGHTQNKLSRESIA